MELMKNVHHQETASPSSVAVADDRPKTYTVMTSSGKPLKIRFVFGKSSKNKPAADGVPTQDHDQERVLEADEKMEIKAKDIISNRQQQQIIQETDHQITVKKSFRAPNDQDYSAPSNEIKLETSKRKLHESYQQLADAKKQRTIKVIDHLPPKKSSSPSSQGGGAATESTSTDKEIANNIILLINGGHDTSSSTMMLVIKIWHKHLNPGELLNKDDLRKMKYSWDTSVKSFDSGLQFRGLSGKPL